MTLRYYNGTTDNGQEVIASRTVTTVDSGLLWSLHGPRMNPHIGGLFGTGLF